MKKIKPALVSVVITTKNEEKHIGRCIKSIKEQSYPYIEVILVDNSSTDRTKEIGKKLGAKVYNIGPERSAQRNLGIAKGKGKYTMYVDADMILSRKVVESCVRVAEKDFMIKGIYVPEIVVGKGFWIKVRAFERSFYDGTVVDCARFFPKKAFEDVKGFDLTMTGPEDWDLDKKIRSIGKVKLIKAPIFHNEGRFNMKKYIEKKVYYSKSMEKYIKKWGKNDPDVKKQLGIFYRLIGIFVYDYKFIKLLRHPILTLGMFYLRLKVGFSCLRLVFRKNKC